MHPDSPHPAQTELAAYAARQTPAPDTLRVSDHLAECAACRQALLRLSSPWGGQAGDFLVEPEDAVPDFATLAGAVDGTLPPAQQEHLAVTLAASPAAREALADLAAFRAELAALPSKFHGPEQPPAGSVPTGATVSATGKVRMFPRRWSPWISLAAAAIVLLSSAWWLATGARRGAWQPLSAEADLSRLPADPQRAVERAARTGEVQVAPLPAELRPPPGTLAGSPTAAGTCRQLGPVGIVVREDRPTLRWTAREGATSYIVYLADDEGRGPVVRQEVPGGTCEWTPSAPLARGAIYQWQMEARAGSQVIERTPRPPAPQTRFQVLDERWNAELTDVEHRYAGNPLVLGTAYARAGLEQAAGQQFAELARRHPGSKIADRLEMGTRGRSLGGE